MNITFNLDTTGYKDKASAKKSIGAICNRTKSDNKIVTMDPEQLIKAVENGRTFTPGELTGTTEEDWKSQQIIAGDIDNKKPLLDENGEPVKENGKVVMVPCEHIIAPEEALEILHANNLDPYFMYYSFSNTPELPKYRIIFILSEKLTDGEEAKKLTGKLANLFYCATKEPNADKSITNLDRLLFGSTPGSVFYNSGHITDKSAFDGLMDPEEEEDGNKTGDMLPNERAKAAWDMEKSEEKARLDRDIENFDLMGYILETEPGSKIHVIGRQTYINPCPICGHKDCFHIKKGAFWADYGGSTSDDTNGSIIDYLMVKNNWPLDKALDFFKHAIMRYPRTTNKSTPTNKCADPGENTGAVEVVPTNIANATKEDLINEEFIKAALTNCNLKDQEQIKEDLVERARELNCGIIKIVKRIANEVINGPQNNELAEKITGYTEFNHKSLNKPLMIGDNFISEDGKIYGIKRGKNRGDIDELYVICPCMVYPLERRCNLENNIERITIAFYKDGKWRERTLDRLQIADSRKAVELTNYGLPITTITAKGFVAYMATVEYMNDIPRVNTSNSFGWAKDPDGKLHFVPYSNTIKLDGVEEFKDLTRAIRPHGDKDKWFNLARKIRNNTNKHFFPQLLMSASLASVLVYLLHLDPIWVNCWGFSGTGKSTSLKLATSIWACPIPGKYIIWGDSTATALYFKASTLKHLPLCIDDLSKIEKRKELSIETLIYALCSGADRSRGNKNRSLDETRTWSNTILSTFERPLLDDNMKGGAINRLLEFELPNKDMFEDPEEVHHTTEANYGFLGPMFIDKVLEIGPEKIRELQEDFEQKIIAAAADLGAKKEAKQIKPLSVILAADKIAAEIFGDGITLNVKQLTQQLKSTMEVSDGQRAYDYLLDYVAINRRNLVSLNRADLDEDEDFNPGVEVYGYTGIEYPNKYAFFNGVQLDKALYNTNHNKNVLLNWLREKQLIKVTPNSFMSPKKIFGRVQKLYAIKIGEVEKAPVTTC